MKSSTRRTLREQGIEPDTTMGRIIADMIEDQERYIQKRDQKAREADTEAQPSHDRAAESPQ